MKNQIHRLWSSGKKTFASQADRALERTCAGRIINTLTFLVMILCLGLWITAFLLLKDQLFVGKLTGSLLTDLTCLTFFGGLVIAILVGALIGNFLRRLFWKLLTKRSQNGSKPVHNP